MDEKEKNASIEYILANGLVKPQPVHLRIAEIIRAVGFRHVFWDTGYAVLCATISATFVFVLFVQSSANYQYSAALAGSPLLYLFIAAFSETTERSCNLHGLKQTCRYTARHISALRVLCFSLMGAAFTAIIAAVGTEGMYGFLPLFTVCLSALFICAVFSLAVMRLSRGKWAAAGYSAAWVSINAALPALFGDRWEQALAGIPVAISIIVAIAAAAVFVYQISRMLSEVKQYALA